MHNFASLCFSSFKIKKQYLIVYKSKKEKGALAHFIAVSLLTSDSVDFFLEVATISYQT